MPHALIVDDQPSDAEVLTVLLNKLGVSTSYAAHGDDVPEILGASPPPDLIFLDIEMPDVNGYDVLAWLREDPNLDPVPIVAYTCHTNLMNTAYEMGFHSFIGKPVRFNEFEEQLERILNDDPVWG